MGYGRVNFDLQPLGLDKMILKLVLALVVMKRLDEWEDKGYRLLFKIDAESENPEGDG